MENTLRHLLPENAEYIGNFYKEGDYYYCTVLIPEGETLTIPKDFEVADIAHTLCVYVHLKIGADYLEYINSKE